MVRKLKLIVLRVAVSVGVGGCCGFAIGCAHAAIRSYLLEQQNTWTEALDSTLSLAKTFGPSGFCWGAGAGILDFVQSLLLPSTRGVSARATLWAAIGLLPIALTVLTMGWPRPELSANLTIVVTCLLSGAAYGAAMAVATKRFSKCGQRALQPQSQAHAIADGRARNSDNPYRSPEA